VLLLSGLPLGDPIVQANAIVLNTDEQLTAALEARSTG
jgi:redox-sensitive bicupin YhaK (pirin superfamily)